MTPHGTVGATDGSHGDQLDVDAGALGQTPQAGRIRRQDLVAVARQTHNRSVDHVSDAGSAQEHSGSSAKGVNAGV